MSEAAWPVGRGVVPRVVNCVRAVTRWILRFLAGARAGYLASRTAISLARRAEDASPSASTQISWLLIFGLEPQARGVRNVGNERGRFTVRFAPNDPKTTRQSVIRWLIC